MITKSGNCQLQCVLKTNHYSSALSLSDVKCSHTFILPFITDKGKNRKETKKKGKVALNPVELLSYT